MALEFAHGAIRWLAADAVNTTYTVNGLAFQPKALRFYWCGLDSAGTDVASEGVNLRRGVGFAVSTSSRRSVASFSQDTAATSNCGTVAADDCVVCTTDGAGGRDSELDLNSITSDGFTLIVDDQGVADLTVFWEAWGGSDITVAAVGDIAEPGATGNQDYTVTGFVSGATDQVVMLAGVQSVAAVNTAEAEASGMFIGFAASATAADNICVSGNSDDASTSMDTDGHCISDECLGMIAKAGAATVGTRAVLTQFGTDNFRLNWAAVSVTNRRSIFLAIKGGRWQSGSLTIAGNSLSSTASVSNTIFTPIGICLIGRMTAEQATNVATANDRIGIGTGTSTSSRRSMGMLDEDATASSVCEINTTIQYDQVLCYPSTAGALLTAYDISSMDTAGFTLINDLAGGVASEWIGYLAFGNAVAKTGTESLPAGLSETATAGVVLTASDSVATQLTESAAITFIALTASDSTAIVVSETDITAFEYNLIESLPINLTESASVDTGGPLPVTGTDSLPAGLSDAATVVSIIADSDSLAVSADETATELVHQFVSDSLGVGLADTSSQYGTLSTADDLLIGMTDNAAVAVTLAAADDATVGLTESAAPIISIASTDSLAVIVSEADIANFEYNLIDSLAVQLAEVGMVDSGTLTSVNASETILLGLTESAFIDIVLSASDSLPAGLIESATQTVTQSASDDLTVAISEASAVASTIATSDSLTVGLTEAATISSSVVASDTITVGLAESASINTGDLAQITASDSVSVAVSETDISRFEYGLIDSFAIGLTESAAAQASSPSDSLTIGLTEAATLLKSLAVSDSLTINTHEPDTISQQVSTYDSLRVVMQEASTVVDLTGGLSSVTSADTIQIGLTESAVVSSTIYTADSVAVGFNEASASAPNTIAGESIPVDLSEVATVVDLTGGFVAQTAADTLALTVEESAVILRVETVGDALPVGINEQSTVEIGGQVSKVGSELLQTGLTEDVSIKVLQSVADSIAVGFAEEHVILNRLGTSSDDVKIVLSEVANIVDLTGGLQTKNSDESIHIGLADEAAIYSTGVADDTEPIGVQEIAAMVVAIATSDSITVGLQSDSQAVSVTLSVEDTLPAGYAEAVIQHVLIAAEDSLGAAFDEAVFIFNEFTAQDDLSVVLIESGQASVFAGLVEKLTSDDVRISLSETGVLFTRTVGTLSPIIATAEYIGIDSRAVESIGLPKTAHPVDGGLPHDAEVIVGA